MATISSKVLLVLVLLLVWVVPGAWWLVSGVEAYLQPLRLWERCVLVAGLVILLFHRWPADWVRPPARGSQNRLVLYLCLVFAVLFAGAWSANLMALLVRAAPGEPYAARFRIVDLSKENRRTDGVRVILCAGRDDFELFLDEDRFSYGRWRPGDVIGVSGRQGAFGVLVERVRRIPDDGVPACQ